MEIIHSLYYIIHKILLYKKNTLYVFIIKFNHLTILPQRKFDDGLRGLFLALGINRFSLANRILGL